VSLVFELVLKQNSNRQGCKREREREGGREKEKERERARENTEGGKKMLHLI
jgi:hypothetical protein